MKKLFLSIIIMITGFFIPMILLVPQSAFGDLIDFPPIDGHFSLWKKYDGNDLIINQVANKTTYNTWEPITITPELINTGNHTVTLRHYSGWIFIEIKYSNGVEWPQTPIGIPLVPPGFSDTLQPGEHLRVKPNYPDQPITLAGTGKWNITSSALFSTSNNDSLMVLSSQPLQVTIVPEFGSFASMIAAMSIAGIVLISKIFRFSFSQNNSLK